MKRLSIIIAFLIGLFQFASASVTKAEVDKDYQENKFADAIEKYEAILASEGESADIYYNLGNSYYKNKNIAKAVLTCATDESRRCRYSFQSGNGKK